MSVALDLDRLLLVEDNLADADFIVELLDEARVRSNEVVRAVDLASAVTALHHQPVDLVLLDLRLPDGYGVVCVEKIRSVCPDVAIVVLTGVSDEEMALKCLEMGAQDYIPKSDLQAVPLSRALAYARARAREVSERRRAEALQIHLATIVDASSDAIVSCTPAGIMTSWNRGAEVIFGYRADEVIGRPAEDFLRAVNPEGERDREILYRQALAGTAPRRSLQAVKSRKDGSLVTLSSVICSLLDENGEVVGLAATYRDLTELQERDREMRALAIRLNQVRELERKRISRAVHDELGQLLTGLKMDLSWIGRRMAGEQVPVDDIKQRLEDAESLIDSTIGTVQKIAVELRPSTLDALGLAAALRDEGRRFEQRASIFVKVETVGEPQPPDEIATALFRIYQELLTNTARHSQASAVGVKLCERDGYFELQVEDDGIGFEEKTLPPKRALGLLSIRERSDALGGSVSFQRGATGGASALIRIPYPSLERAERR